MKIKPIILKDAEEDVQDYSKFLVDNKDVNNDLNDFVDGRIEHGYTLGISCFDEYYVAKKFEFYGIVGKKGRGKTTINQAIQVAHSVANGLIWVVAFQENSAWSMKLNYLNYLLCDFAKDVKKNNLPLYKKALKWVEEHFIFLKVETIKEALETTQYLIQEKDIDVHAVFLDPINSFDSGYYNSGNSYQDMVDTSKKILRHSKDVCSVHVSQHPTMSGQRQEEDVNSFQAEGGAILNKASFTYAINRDSGSSNNRISVDNVRNRHTGGNETSADNPVILNWSPTKIGLGNLVEGVKEQNIIDKLKRIYNPLDEDFGEKEPETMPTIDVQEAFGNVEDIPF
jgi:energy-coupling factor transporter ATP-binding protein EcfA2